LSEKTKVNEGVVQTDKDEPQYLPDVVLTPGQQSQAVLLSILGWLVPGAGHWYLGKYVKGLLFFVLLNGLFYWGMVLDGEIAIPVLDVHSAEFNFVNILVFIFGCGNGLMTLLNLMPFAKFGDISLSTYEVGTLFMVVSGSLNVFVTMNAWDCFRNGIESKKQGMKK
jgi:hypothetical protein